MLFLSSIFPEDYEYSKFWDDYIYPAWEAYHMFFSYASMVFLFLFTFTLLFLIIIGIYNLVKMILFGE